ncbi:MAG: hypothetical protein IKF68_04440 [Erysipelotrichaceae bacterium]|nr:hypothetical protein [Erysipelotrichaceae bacterium]
MKTLHRLIYISVSFISYVLLALLAFFVLDDALDIISTDRAFHLVCAVIWLLFIDPFICYMILNKLPIRPSLRLKGNIREDMKREV